MFVRSFVCVAIQALTLALPNLALYLLLSSPPLLTLLWLWRLALGDCLILVDGGGWRSFICVCTCVCRDRLRLLHEAAVTRGSLLHLPSLLLPHIRCVPVPFALSPYVVPGIASAPDTLPTPVMSTDLAY